MATDTELHFPSLTFPFYRMTFVQMVQALQSQYEVIKYLEKKMEEMDPLLWESRIMNLEEDNNLLKQKMKLMEKRVAQLQAKVYKPNGRQSPKSTN